MYNFRIKTGCNTSKNTYILQCKEEMQYKYKDII
jgi:hypothetical protein